jgi:hypothetical protein
MSRTRKWTQSIVQVEAKLLYDYFEPRGSVTGYYQQIGVTYESTEGLETLISDFLQESGGVLVKVEDSWIPEFEGRDREILEKCGDWRSKGVWYSSGRAFFSDEEG